VDKKTIFYLSALLPFTFAGVSAKSALTKLLSKDMQELRVCFGSNGLPSFRRSWPRIPVCFVFSKR